MAQKTYDSTVVRVAGNIASGLGPLHIESLAHADDDRVRLLSAGCLRLARQIVADAIATEPVETVVKK